MPKANGTSKNTSKSTRSKNLFARPSSSSSNSPSKRSAQISQSNTSTSSIPITDIDNVVFGTLLFKTWYQSYTYPSAVLNPSPSNPNALRNTPYTDKIEHLFVCNHCFKYSKVLKEYAGHLKVCERNGMGEGGLDMMVPGRRIYTHGETGWGIWEVDGDIDAMYCQNLSLFSKLFLDNKSVFFDVSGFKYYLLVYTTPSQPNNAKQPKPTRQVVGFFSKEKLSWDQNNLACILIFPPWQRKSLGCLLISISYEISRRENILGGPEKPISELGKRGYMRYWQGEIARYLIHSCKEKSTSVESISKATWIYVEDVLMALRAMAADGGGDGLIRPVKWNGKGERGRVRIDKERLRVWAEENRVDLRLSFYEDGFVEGYGYRKVGEDGEEEEDGED